MFLNFTFDFVTGKMIAPWIKTSLEVCAGF